MTSSWNEPALIVGLGQVGKVFAEGLLREGYPVFPVLRGMPLADALRAVPNPELVLLSVGENDLEPLLAGVSPAPALRLVLVQNELVPAVWEQHGHAPSIVVVWFEQKAGQPLKEVLPSVIFGPAAPVLTAALHRVGVRTRTVASEAELLFELVLKNLYILVLNLAGLAVGGSVRELWEEHAELALAVSRDVLDLQEALTGRALPRDALIAGLRHACAADPAHGCRGRTAPERLARALDQAARHGLAVPTLRQLARDHSR